MNLYSLGEAPAAYAGDDQAMTVVVPARLFPSPYVDDPAAPAFYTGLLVYSFGFGGDDVLTGDDPADADLRWDVANDLMYGGTGNDSLFGGAGENYLFGQDGNDVLAVTAGNSFLFGGRGDDVLQGGTGYAQMEGGAGRGPLHPGRRGHDRHHRLCGGAGRNHRLRRPVRRLPRSARRMPVALDADGDGRLDDIRFTQPGGGTTTVLNLALDDLMPGDFLLQGAGFVDGSAGDDLVSSAYVDAQGDRIGDGHDLVYLGAGNDVLQDGLGNDTVHGGIGNDTLTGSSGRNLFFGGYGDDVLSTGVHSSILYGGAGDDRLQARLHSTASHVMTGGAGADRFEFVGTSVDRVCSARGSRISRLVRMCWSCPVR
jgi:Ca2+-binding RTX toxin-like protein